MAYCDFPAGFSFGAATSSLQVEGFPSADGSGNTTWGIAAATPGGKYAIAVKIVVNNS